MRQRSLKVTFILFQVLSTICQSLAASDTPRKSPAEKFQLEDDSNSEALNNFLGNVLRAKDELKWIDRTISSVYRQRNGKRKLLWSHDGNSKRWIRDRSDDNNAEGIQDGESAANEVDIETILDDLGYSGENSKAASTSLGKNAERRRYPISDLTGTGIIEYYDYEGEVGKRDSLDSFNASGGTISTDDRLDIPKKQQRENMTHMLPKQEFISSDQAEGSKSKKFAVDFDDENSEDQDRDLEVIRDIEDGDRAGRPARCHRAGDGDMLFHSHFVEIQEYQVIPKAGHNVDQSNYRSAKAVKPGRTFYVISPVNSGEANSSMTSGSDYQALKITDDMFKGGIEQGNSIEESPAAQYPNSVEIDNDKHWKLIQDEKPMLEEFPVPVRKTPIEIHRQEINNEAREKLSAQVGPMIYHESIVESVVEPLNWPWDDDSQRNPQIGFGRELMQASETNKPRAAYVTSSESTPSKSLSSSVTRHRDTNQDFKVFWRPRALTYLDRKRHRHKQKFLKNRSRHTEDGRRVKRYTNGVARVARFVAKNPASNSMDELHLGRGEIAEKIVDKIFDQVEKNQPLKVSLGPGLQRRPKVKESFENQAVVGDPEELRHTEEIMKKVMELLGHLVSDEVQHKSCTKLPQHLHEFLLWMLGDEEESRTTQRTSSPATINNNPKEEDAKSKKFLSPSTKPPQTESQTDDDLYRKVRLLRNLIKEYHSLTIKEQTKVQTVHDYLERQLRFVLKYIDSREKAKGHQSPSPKKRSEPSLEYEELEDENESHVSLRRRRQVRKKDKKMMMKKQKKKKKKRKQKKKNKSKKHGEGNKKGKKLKRKKGKHHRKKRSANDIRQILPWEIPRIIHIGDLKFLSNVSSLRDGNWATTQVDNELRRLFGDVRLNEFTSVGDNFTNKSEPGLLPVTLGSDSKIHPHELFTEKIPNTTITVVSLTTGKEFAKECENKSANKSEEISEVTNIENKEDNSRTLHSLESKINVFPIST